jgi:hypothetical protein
VAIVQISQITNRKGRAADLPQLAGAELGWSTDTRQLFIGNGTLQDGAPVIGNTEILTEFSDILAFTNTYTYQGEAAGYTVQTGVTPGTPVVNSLQTVLDQWASVLDFGAVGDGVTDDTAAINRALYQLYCRETNTAIRRSLFFPAGTYLVSGTINIPSYATLYGEGSDNSVITMAVGSTGYVAQTADSLQNTGSAIASAPQYITVTNMGFTNLNANGSVFLVDATSNCTFQNVGFRGASTTSNLTNNINGSMGVSFSNTNGTGSPLVCEQIVFDSCVFSGLVWGVFTNSWTKSVVICNSQFTTLYQGIVLGFNSVVNGGATGTRIVNNMFDVIYAEGVEFGQYLSNGLNATGHNIFYDVANGFGGAPLASIINIQTNNNISISDLFQRADNVTYPRINLVNNTTGFTTLSIATNNGNSLSLGSFTQYSGQQFEILNAQTGTIFTVSSNRFKTLIVDYGLVRDGTAGNDAYRTGTFWVASAANTNILTAQETFTQNANTGVALSFSQNASNISFNYSATDTGVSGTISYSIRSLI